MRRAVSFIIFIVYISTYSQSANKNLVLDNVAYENTIKTVRIFDSNLSQNSTINGAIAAKNSRSLRLEFDDLVVDAEYYFVRIIHCNSDWTKSQMKDMEFLDSYNEFNINNYDFSIDTRQPYVHYSFTFPNLKLSGNYLAVVYRDENPEDIVLSHRFILTDNIVSVMAENTLSSGVLERNTNHQIEFNVNYGNLQINNPQEEIKIVIRQNQRWDNAIQNLKPTFIRSELSQLEYRHFNFENNFKAGNEFRFIDLRSVNFRGQNISHIETSKSIINAYVIPDKTRNGIPYSLPINRDLDGQFVIANLDTQPATTSSEYVNTHFFLQSAKQIEDIYLVGQFNNWIKDKASKMRYSSKGGYTNSTLLKQGWYNYTYYLNGEDSNNFEGNYVLTENEYDVIVYYSKMGSRGDIIVGYRRFRTAQ